MMNIRSFNRVHGVAILALATLAGRHNSSSNSTSADAAKADKAKPPFNVIRAGHPPFSTIITQTGRIEIVDFDDNHKVIVKKTKVVPNTLITLNTTGISLNTTTLSNKPLSRQHTYEIRMYP